MKKIVSSILVLLMMLSVTIGNVKIIVAETEMDIATRVQEKLDSMTVEQKVGQMLQPDMRFISTEDVSKYEIGSVLSGGGAAPGWFKNSARDWADLINSYQSAAISGSGIPLLYGVDAVHGHNNVDNATIFPHNIGLGQADDVELVRKIANVTANEMRATGANWAFTPTLGMPKNERWGRTYETYGEDVDLVSRLGATYIEGSQGNLVDCDTAIGTAKHFIGEGMATDGKNQGDVPMALDGEEFQAYLNNELLPPYEAAIRSGVKSVMVSYGSIHGVKSHGDQDLITGILKEQLDFKGIVLSDFNGVDQLGGIFVPYKAKVIQGVNAGIDMLMVSSIEGLQPKWKATRQAILDGIKEGSISMNRIDDAVRRILTVKFEMGLMDNPEVAYAREDLLAEFGSQEHRDVARDAVRKSLTLLKNDYTSNQTTIMKDLESKKNIIVAGSSANDIGRQSGGWTISWQGGLGATTQGTTIYEGIKQHLGDEGLVRYIKDGVFDDKSVEAAIVVAGETPYAESNGDRWPDQLTLPREDISTIDRIRAEHPDLPIILIIANGRPLTIANQIDKVNAVVMAGLPGSEGSGVADVLFNEEYDFGGKLSITWPTYANDIPIKFTNPAAVMFPYGFGLSKVRGSGIPPIPEIDDSVDLQYTNGVIEAERFVAKSQGITVSSNGQYVENLDKNRVLIYQIKVAKAASCNLSVAAAALSNRPNAFEFYVDGKKILTNTMQIPKTGRWDRFKTTSIEGDIHLTEGVHNIQLLAKTNSFNLDKLILKEIGEYIAEEENQSLGKGDLIKPSAVNVTLSSADQSQSMDWYKGAMPIENADTAKNSLDIRESDKTNMTTIKINPKEEKQKMLGMGTSIEEATIYNMMKMSPEARRAFILDLIDPVNGMGMNIIRLTVGASDFTSREFYTYFDTPPKNMKKIDWEKGFSIQKDREYGIIQGVKEIQAIAKEIGVEKDLKFFASPWTPPGWMKKTSWISWLFPKNDLKLKGGILRDDQISNLGKYLARFVEEYQKEGIPIYAITLQNEPGFETNYPSCVMDGKQTAKVAAAFRAEISNSQALSSREKKVKVWGYDFNFSGGEKFVDDMMQTAGSESIDGIAFHPYMGDVSTMEKVQKKYPNLSMHLTERSVWGTSGLNQMVDWFRNDAQSYNAWVTMLDSDITPHQWTGTPDPTLFVQDATNPNIYWKTPEVGLITQFTKYVKPGFRRIQTNNGTKKTITNVAFKNMENDDLVLVVVNDSDKEQEFKVVFEGAQFNAMLSANNVATYRWNLKDKELDDNSILKAERLIMQKGSKIDIMSAIEALDYDGVSDIKDKVRVISENVNPNKTGSYIVKYEVENALGNVLKLERNVDVVLDLPLPASEKLYHLYR